jgi:hypothetical protein
MGLSAAVYNRLFVLRGLAAVGLNVDFVRVDEIVLKLALP